MGRHRTPMTRQQALEILAYDIADLVERNDGYDGLIPDDKFTQDDLIATLHVLLAANGISDKPAPADEPEFVVHTCNGGKGPFFGRLAKPGTCPRCDELHNGAERRSAPAWVDDRNRRDSHDRQREAAAREHHAPNGPHARGVCGPVCTFQDR